MQKKRATSPRPRRLTHLRPSTIEGIRLTIPAREALARAGNEVHTHVPADVADVGPADWPLYDVVMIRPPQGLLLAAIDDGSYGLRRKDEADYPGEVEAEYVTWDQRGQLVPCPEPECGYALLWCEAGYVPGWRICLAGHACQLSPDGRSATRHPGQDDATLRSTSPVSAAARALGRHGDREQKRRAGRKGGRAGQGSKKPRRSKQ